MPKRHPDHEVDGFVVPRDAASLVLFRGTVERPEVLMGRRRDDLRFMPGFHVFPGGTVDPTDAEIGRSLRAHPAMLRALNRHAWPKDVEALIWAAIRETWEETAGLFGHANDGALPPGFGAAPCEAARAFADAAITPATETLDFIARAVTPRDRPMRFDSRFFLGDGNLLRGEVRSTGELEDVTWTRAEFALATFPMAHITRFVLSRALAIWCAKQASTASADPIDRSIALFTQRGDNYAMIEDQPGDPPQPEADGLDWQDPSYS